MGRTDVASETGLRLDAADEFPHAVDDVVNFNESVYASGWNAGTKMGGWMRLGNRVNEGYAELSVCLYLPDGRVACQFKRPEISTNEGFDAGGLRYGVTEPFKSLEMEYEGELLVLDDPEDLRDPKKMFDTAPRAEGHVRFDIRGVSPVHGGEAMTPEAERLMFYGPRFSRGHFNQHTGVRGEIKVGDEVEYPMIISRATGRIALAGDPTSPLHAATKQYVDSASGTALAAAAAPGTQTAIGVMKGTLRGAIIRGHGQSTGVSNAIIGKFNNEMFRWFIDGGYSITTAVTGTATIAWASVPSAIIDPDYGALAATIDRGATAGSTITITVTKGTSGDLATYSRALWSFFVLLRLPKVDLQALIEVQDRLGNWSTVFANSGPNMPTGDGWWTNETTVTNYPPYGMRVTFTPAAAGAIWINEMGIHHINSPMASLRFASIPMSTAGWRQQHLRLTPSRTPSWRTCRRSRSRATTLERQLIRLT